MPISYRVDENLKIVIAEWVGDITVDQVETHFNNLVADQVALNYHKSLADISKANFNFKGSDLLSVIDRVLVPVLKGKKWRCAIYYSEIYQLGVAYQFDIFAQTITESAMFAEKEPALTWLATV